MNASSRPIGLPVTVGPRYPKVMTTTARVGCEMDLVMDDASLAVAIARNDADAIRILVDRESGRMLRLATRVTGDRHSAEDAVQEALVIGCRSIATYRGDGSLGAWLSRIATRIALRRRRKEDRTQPFAEGFDMPDPNAGGMSAALASGTVVRDAIACLPPHHREVVILHYFAELSLEEIATASGRPVGTVKSHLHRALRRLRVELAREVAA